ncbi:MAG: HIT domain-containing protein [Psychrobium sp.]
MFELDKRLANDTVVVGNFPLSVVLMSRDSRYPWCILVPRVADITESYQLTIEQQQQLCLESAMIAETLMAEFKGDSMNVAALGNVVSQLHVHHVVRFTNDDTWPGPIWGVGQVVPYSDEALIAMKSRIGAVLATQQDFIAD